MEVTGHPSKRHLPLPPWDFFNTSNFYRNSFHKKHYQNTLFILK